MTPAKKATPSLASMVNKENEEPTTVAPENVEAVQPVDSEVEDPNLDADENYEDEKNDPFLSPAVVATVPNKTPAALAAETPEETSARYGVTAEGQVPSGTHLHPDVAEDYAKRGVNVRTTDSAQVTRQGAVDIYDFAPDAEHNDKWDSSLVKQDDDEEE
jgi:hypothetical protein